MDLSDVTSVLAGTAQIFLMVQKVNLLTLYVNYSGRTAPLISNVAFYIFIQQIHVLNVLNMVYTLRFSFQNADFFLILTYLVPVLFTFYIQVC